MGGKWCCVVEEPWYSYCIPRVIYNGPARTDSCHTVRKTEPRLKVPSPKQIEYYNNKRQVELGEGQSMSFLHMSTIIGQQEHHTRSQKWCDILLFFYTVLLVWWGAVVSHIRFLRFPWRDLFYTKICVSFYFIKIFLNREEQRDHDMLCTIGPL